MREIHERSLDCVIPVDINRLSIEMHTFFLLSSLLEIGSFFLERKGILLENYKLKLQNYELEGQQPSKLKKGSTNGQWDE